MDLPYRRETISEIENIYQLIIQRNSLNNKALQGLDLSRLEIPWDKIDVQDTLFLGCKFASPEDEYTVKRRGHLFFPDLTGYRTIRTGQTCTPGRS